MNTRVKGLTGKIHLSLVIHRLDLGGAERQLLALADGLEKEKFQVEVITFYPGGCLEDQILDCEGLTVTNLGRKGRWGAPLCLVKLARALRRSRAHVVYGFMEVPSQMSLLAGRVLGIRVIWGLRRSRRYLGHYDWAERSSFRTGRFLSRGADFIIFNSAKGRDDYLEAGYHPKRMAVIPNGIDTNRFKRDPGKGSALKKSLGIEPGAKLVGMVSRIHPMKGHEVFLRAAGKLSASRSDVFFVCAGRGDKQEVSVLRSLTARLGLEKRVLWLGEIRDVVGLYSALDVLCSSSLYGEGFPNVIGEAMSCGVPCVVTDVGDSALVVGSTGLVVSRGDPGELASAVAGLLSRPPEELSRMGEHARIRVQQHFSLERMVYSTSRIIEDLLGFGARS